MIVVCSLLRLDKVEEVITDYEKEPKTGEQFLQSEMGEDRFLCTLLIEKGYKLAYNPAAQASTHVPSTFEEYFKQVCCMRMSWASL